MKISDNVLVRVKDSDIKNGTFVIPDGITEIGENAFYGCTSLENITIPSNITIIRTCAFQNCKLLKNITIPSSVTTIGNQAFAYCESLESITLPDSVTRIREYVFAHCKSLTNITIPSSVTEIGDSAFSDCESLKSIEIPSSVTQIGHYAFSDCDSLTNITIPSGVTTIGSFVFYACISLKNIILPDSVKTIGYGAFSDCEALENITFPSSVTTIEGGAFYYCKSLKDITIPRNITITIGCRDFYFCASLKNVTLPDCVKEIGKEAFAGCTSLENITLPNSILEIGENAFYGCTSLENITIPSSVTKIDNGAFDDCTSLKNIILSGNVTEIGDYAFKDCKLLESITLPDSVTKIDDGTFSGCKSLKNITLSDSIKKIGKWSFENCRALQSITFPDGVIEIGSHAFEHCESLQNVTLPNSIIKIEETAFNSCVSLENIIFPSSIRKIKDFAFVGCASLKNATFLSSLVNVNNNNRDTIFKDCHLLQNIIVYNQKIDKNNLEKELNKVRQIELLDKIIFCLSNRGISDNHHYEYNNHKKFIRETIKKYEDSEYYYKDDFDKYIEEYILNVSSTYDDEQMKKLYDSLNKHQVENLDANDVHSIVTYGNALESYPNYFTGMLQLITNHYGIDSASTNIKKVVDTISKPQNLVQFLSAAFDSYNGGTKYYLNKEAISKLQKFADINVDRLTQGIIKAEKLKAATEIYMEKMDQYIKNLLSFKPVQPSENLPETLKNPISIKEEVSQKLELYQANMTMMVNFYGQVNNLIEEYTEDVLKLKGVQETLLPGVKMASSLNKGIIRTEQNIGMLEKILSSYKDLLGNDSEEIMIEKDIKAK